MNSTITVSPGHLSGTVLAPPSKSAAHRALLCAAMCSGVSVISNVSFSEDISATASAIRALGAEVQAAASGLTVKGFYQSGPFQNAEIFCNESGSTLRFIIPVALCAGGSFSFSGAGRLMERPLDDYFRIFDEKGVRYKKDGQKLYIEGKLAPGSYRLSGNVSSQYITGLLLALPVLNGDSEIIITTPVESKGYIDMTVEMLHRFGIEILVNSDYRRFVIGGNQKFVPQNITVEGDYSQAAFFLVANELGSHVAVEGLEQDSVQGDRAVLKMIGTMRENVPCRKIDVSQVPDLVPILAVLAAKSEGWTEFTGARRLRLKESDRLHAICTELSKLGVETQEFEDALKIKGGKISGGRVDSHNDHRMAMALGIAATAAESSIVIDGADSVKKSYADFWEKFKELGGVITDGVNIREDF